MNKIILATMVFFGVGFASAFAQDSRPAYVVETLPSSQYSTSTFAGAIGYTSAVTISSSVITKVDTAFDTYVSSTITGIGPTYQRVELTIQNNDTTDKYCGFQSVGLTTSNSYKIGVGATWTFKIGKGMGLYCLNAAGSSGTMIVGGVAWK